MDTTKNEEIPKVSHLMESKDVSGVNVAQDGDEVQDVQVEEADDELLKLLSKEVVYSVPLLPMARSCRSLLSQMDVDDVDDEDVVSAPRRHSSVAQQLSTSEELRWVQLKISRLESQFYYHKLRESRTEEALTAFDHFLQQLVSNNLVDLDKLESIQNDETNDQCRGFVVVNNKFVPQQTLREDHGQAEHQPVQLVTVPLGHQEEIHASFNNGQSNAMEN